MWSRVRFSAAAALFAVVSVPQFGHAQDFDLTWYTFDGGGLTSSTGGDWSLGGTIGQIDAGARLTGGGWELAGGFWSAAVATPPSTPGDFDGDGDVDLSDLSVLLSNFGCADFDCAADVDGDSDTDLSDLTILLANFGQ